ncbi:MAG: nitroreductase family protein [Candidatus Pacearchaeota archaeon]|jgi:nitroreductase
MDIEKALKERHSVHKFKSKKPDWRNIIESIDAARYAPMAGGNYTVKFILVDNSEIIKKIALECQQDFVGTVHYIVVVCSKPGRTINSYGKQGEVYARQQAGAAIENFLLSIENHGLATCWVGYFVERNIKDILEIPEDVNIEAVFPIGFELEKKHTRKSKIDLDSILYFNSYKQKRMSIQKN